MGFIIWIWRHGVPWYVTLYDQSLTHCGRRTCVATSYLVLMVLSGYLERGCSTINFYLWRTIATSCEQFFLVWSPHLLIKYVFNRLFSNVCWYFSTGSTINMKRKWTTEERVFTFCLECWTSRETYAKMQRVLAVIFLLAVFFHQSQAQCNSWVAFVFILNVYFHD